MKQKTTKSKDFPRCSRCNVEPDAQGLCRYCGKPTMKIGLTEVEPESQLTTTSQTGSSSNDSSFFRYEVRPE